MLLKTENSRRVGDSRPVCAGLKSLKVNYDETNITYHKRFDCNLIQKKTSDALVLEGYVEYCFDVSLRHQMLSF